MLLEKINKPNDIKNIKKTDYGDLAKEIRMFLLENVSKTGGHLASNLGAVELTMALHLVLDVTKDRIVWDVGHQAYVHKILSGRKNEFPTLRKKGGLSGFPKPCESECDAFSAGHASTSISAALGMAVAAEANGDDRTIVAVIGDGSLTGGMAYEALNNTAKLKRNLIIILNDNNMSISEPVGGMSTYLSNVRAGGTYNDIKSGVTNTLEMIPHVGKGMVKRIRKTKNNIKKLLVPGSLFEDLDITYLGPIDGHNVFTMCRILSEAKRLDHPVVIHVCTKKGKGFSPAENNTEKYHGIAPFSLKTGNLRAKKTGPSYSEVFGDALVDVGKKNEKIVAITAAMSSGTGTKKFAEAFPDRFFDVGIAEEHAVTFAAGLAMGGMKPFVAIYSTFLQRAYDQILHDVCIQNLPVTFCIDRAGLVGNDGITHQGLFDISYLSMIPNMNILAPKNGAELVEAVNFAADFDKPLAIRYPRGTASHVLDEFDAPLELGKSEMIYDEEEIALIFVGSMASNAVEIRNSLKEDGRKVSLVNARFVKPLDKEMLDRIFQKHKLVVTLEENMLQGGFGEAVLEYANESGAESKILNIAVPDMFVEQGSGSEQMQMCGIDAASVLEKIRTELVGLI